MMLTKTQNTLVEHQIELEKLYSKNQTIPRIKREFTHCADFDFKAYMIAKKIKPEFGFDVLAHIALHKRAALSTMIGVLYHHFNDAQLTCDELLKTAVADLIDWSPELKLFVVKFSITQDVQDDLDRYQYPLPMVVPPKEIKKNKQSGYLLGSSSVILKNNHHDDDVCLDHLNRMNQLKLTINADTALMIKNKWRGLDKAKIGETKEEFEKRKRAFDKYDRTSKDVMALIMDTNDHFYLTHKYDKRGRIYCGGYHVNYQGTPWNKAVVEFAEKECVV